MNDTVEKKVKQTAREASQRVDEISAKTTEGLRDCQTTIIEATRANVNAMFDYAQEAITAKSVPELIELSTTHARRQLEMMTEQAREIADATQKLITQNTTSLSSGFTKTFSQMS